VTHDQVEAMTMGDRVAVMRKGELQQVDSPQQLYDHPVNLFVGGFIGSPAMNMLEATLEQRDGTMLAKVGTQELTLGEHTLSARPALRRYGGRTVVLGIRPEDLQDGEYAADVSSDEHLRGEVALREALGSEVMVHFKADAKPAFTEDVRELARDAGNEDRHERSAAAGGATLVGRFDPRSRVQEGEQTTVAVNTRSLHFFDPETGQGIYDQAE
jgi:multiple sugar transport system ATP-binding protein